MGFDGMRADYYSSGEYYIVKSPIISIQGRYLPTKFTNGLAVTKMVAIGGPLLKGNKLIIGPLAATWNGAPILGGFPSHFDQPGIVHVDYDNVGALVDTALDASKKKIVHVKIFDGSPEGLMVQVNRWTASAGNEYVNWKITMHSRPGQDGHCGNFNGNAADDDRMAVRQRVGTQGVPAGPELLFATKTPVTVANRPDINNCPTATLDAAKADCRATFGGMSPKMSCLLDYCFAGKEVALNKHQTGVKMPQLSHLNCTETLPLPAQCCMQCPRSQATTALIWPKVNQNRWWNPCLCPSNFPIVWVTKLYVTHWWIDQ